MRSRQEWTCPAFVGSFSKSRESLELELYTSGWWTTAMLLVRTANTPTMQPFLISRYFLSVMIHL